MQQHLVAQEGLDVPVVAVDGSTEPWFDDAQGAANVFTGPEHLRVVRHDEVKLCDLRGCTFAVTVEDEVEGRGPPAGGSACSLVPPAPGPLLLGRRRPAEHQRLCC